MVSDSILFIFTVLVIFINAIVQAFPMILTSLLFFLFPITANLPGTRSYLAEYTHLHGFYTAQSYLKHYDRLTTGLAKGGKSQKEIGGILKSLGILEDRQNVAVGDLFRRGLSEG